MRLQYAKVWQTDDYKIVFQVRLPKEACEEDTITKKCFFIADVTQRGFSISLLPTKPIVKNSNHAFITMLRKHCKTGTIERISKSEDGSLLLWLNHAGYPFLLKMTKASPPHFDFVDLTKAKSMMRFGQKGTFTKRIDWQGPKDGSPTEFIDELIRQYISTQLESVDEGEVEDEEIKSDIPSEQRALANRLKRKLKTVRKSFEKTRSSVPTSDDIDIVHHKAKLLQQYAYLVKPEQIELELDSALTGLDQSLTIELDPDRKVGDNIEAYFKEWKKLKRSQEILSKRSQDLAREVEELESHVLALRSENQAPAYLEDLVTKYKLPTLQLERNRKQIQPVSIPYKTYTLESGWRILVGKGPKENDELTKNAQGHDMWVHVSSGAGSHVIIPRSGQPKKQDPPEDVVRAAAMLAIYHSKQRTDLAGEVYLTRKDKIRKKKGLPAGLWLVEHAPTRFYRFSSDEMARLLDRLS